MHSKPSKISSMEGLMFTTSRVLGVLRGCSLSIFVVDDYGIRFWFGFPVTIFSSLVLFFFFSSPVLLFFISFLPIAICCLAFIGLSTC